MAEIDAFVPRPLADYEEERCNMFEQYRHLNPWHTDESFAKFVDDHIAFAATEKVQFTNQFNDRFMMQYVMVTILSHALCKAAINTILAIGLAAINAQDLFAILEKTNVKEKWCVAPKSISSSYEFNRGTALFETLDHLTKERNAISHSKINLRISENPILEGSKLKRNTFQEKIRWMRRFFSLPYDLSTYAELQLREIAMIQVFHDRFPIP